MSESDEQQAPADEEPVPTEDEFEEEQHLPTPVVVAVVTVALIVFGVVGFWRYRALRAEEEAARSAVQDSTAQTQTTTSSP